MVSASGSGSGSSGSDIDCESLLCARRSLFLGRPESVCEGICLLPLLSRGSVSPDRGLH